jgi:hypothetical protein
MGGWLRQHGQFGTLLLAMILAAGCTGSAATWPALETPGASAGPRDVHTAQPGTRTAAPQETGAGPIVTAPPTTVGKITVDYVYRSDYITCLAHLYGTRLADYLIVTVKNDNPQPVKVVVSSEITGFTNQRTDTVSVPANDSLKVLQNPQLTTAALDQLTSLRPAQLHVVVAYLDEGVSRTVIDQNDPTNVWARRDFPWYIKGMSQQEDFELLAVMVMPLDPAVENLIATARKYDPSGAMVGGYDSEDDANGTVASRLESLWKAEANDYTIGYVSTTLSFAPGEPQRIRLPAEVLDQKSGNCIELTILYASAVEALGMQPVIILVPGHAYLGVRVDSVSNYYYFVETTMIGQTTFDEALAEGGNEFDEATPYLEAGDKDYGWVSVAEARQSNITPIPWH